MQGVDLSGQFKFTYEVDWNFGVNFASTFAFSSIFLILPSSIQNSFTIKLNQHLHYLHSTFNTVLHKLWHGSFQAERELFRYPDHWRGQELFHLTLWIIYLTLHPLEFVVPFVHQRILKVEYVHCMTCNIALCLEKDVNCFQQYHPKHSYISQVQFCVFVTSSYSTWLFINICTAIYFMHFYLRHHVTKINVIKANLNVMQNFFILLSIYEKLPLRTRGISVFQNFPGNWQQVWKNFKYSFS